MADIIHMTLDGRITIDKCMVGRYVRHDVWAENGSRHDKDGNLIVPLIYHAYFITGKSLQYAYSRQEIKEWASSHLHELLRAYHSMSDKDAEAAIKTAMNK